jgi:hypothetical protein
MPVLVEGYKPPHDPRLNHFSVTPDPGVIEANIHPAATWDELVHITTTLYEEARHSRLCTEKFMLDGRHTGTGGGNHVVLGGPTPADSPLLRRPDLLRRASWGSGINHPSLSYLFSGMFVGPTSQHPRVDEARHDACPRARTGVQTDCTADRGGRARRGSWTGCSATCSPTSPATRTGPSSASTSSSARTPPSGRLGLVELRAFRDAAARPDEPRPATVAAGAGGAVLEGSRTTSETRPLGHGAARPLHAAALRGARTSATCSTTLRPERVCSRPGVVRRRTSSSASRCSASVARRGVETGTTAPPSSRGTCSAKRATARRDGAVRRFVGRAAAGEGAGADRPAARGGVQRPPRAAPPDRDERRVRGRRPVPGVAAAERCLHPTIPVHSPLVFDLLDTWNDRSSAGARTTCRTPAGGRYETFPVNALDAAESRRCAPVRRARPHARPGGRVPPAEPNPEFPLTLDLRQPEPATRLRLPPRFRPAGARRTGRECRVGAGRIGCKLTGTCRARDRKWTRAGRPFTEPGLVGLCVETVE